MPRPSPVRDALRGVFSSRNHEAWSLDELLERVRSTIGSGDYSTVFRAVGVLEGEGLIQRVDLGDGLSRYEARRAHHEHVRCETCGRVAEVPGCVVEGAFKEIEESTGYRLSGHSLVFSGVCRDCAGAPSATP
ncbi:MAG TPA: transcriptional repressor [Candidatus Acidoferrales bacterium]|nr:transcriptional repressor [Candidatus Acidoferrales bacterium]